MRVRDIAGLLRLAGATLLLSATAISTGCGSGVDTTTVADTVTGECFSATMLSTTPDGVTSEARIDACDQAYRLEVVGGRRASIAIVRYDLDLVWLLIPEDRTYIVLGLDSLKTDTPHFFSPDVRIERDEGTTDTVDGVEAIRYEVKTSGAGGEHEGTMWEAVDMPGRPLKWVDAVTGLETVWKDAETGPADAGLFELPEGYEELQQEE